MYFSNVYFISHLLLSFKMATCKIWNGKSGNGIERNVGNDGNEETQGGKAGNQGGNAGNPGGNAGKQGGNAGTAIN